MSTRLLPLPLSFGHQSNGGLTGSGYSENYVYVHEAPLRRTARAVEIVSHSRKLEGQPAFVLLLPFAIVFDVVTFPLQLIAQLASHDD